MKKKQGEAESWKRLRVHSEREGAVAFEFAFLADVLNDREAAFSKLSLQPETRTSDRNTTVVHRSHFKGPGALAADARMKCESQGVTDRIELVQCALYEVALHHMRTSVAMVRGASYLQRHPPKPGRPSKASLLASKSGSNVGKPSGRKLTVAIDDEALLAATTGALNRKVVLRNIVHGHRVANGRRTVGADVGRDVHALEQRISVLKKTQKPRT